MTSPSPAERAPDVATTCPSCGAQSAGNFCASCGAPVSGATCAGCRAPLSAGARFCHRCGTPVGAETGRRPSGVSSALPWSVAAIALLALIALAAGQRFSRGSAAAATESVPPEAGAAIVRAPDISSLSPAERAERLYDRVMGAAERGRVDSVRFFLPMAMQAYEAIGDLTLDQRYDLGRLGEVAGDAALARAQADSILRRDPRHLLGLVLGARAARLRGDERAARNYLERLARFEPDERRRQLPEYLLHANDIDAALAEARQVAP